MSDTVIFANSYAILNEKNEVVSCGERRATKWWYAQGGARRSKIKIDCIGRFVVETSFRIASRVLDGPHLFWQVTLSSPPPLKDDSSGGFLSALNTILTPVCNTLEEAWRAAPPWRFHQRFGTREAALEFHALVKKQAGAKERMTKKMPEKTQELLIELGYWCEQKWGRQAQVARAVGTTPQTVNDWLNGRKKMTGEQSLRVMELLSSERRRNK
jgi:predicted XRE-type DNA-binding protein